MCFFVVLSIFSLTVGIETSIGIPVVGLYNQVSTGQTLNLFLSRNLGEFNLEMAGGIENFNSKNTDYLLEDYSFMMGFSRKARFMNIIARIGLTQIKRTLDESREKGFGMAYDFGLGVPIKFEHVLVSPLVFYRGLTDLASSAGSLYLGLRFGYEL